MAATKRHTRENCTHFTSMRNNEQDMEKQRINKEKRRKIYMRQWHNQYFYTDWNVEQCKSKIREEFFQQKCWLQKITGIASQTAEIRNDNVRRALLIGIQWILRQSRLTRWRFWWFGHVERKCHFIESHATHYLQDSKEEADQDYDNHKISWMRTCCNMLRVILERMQSKLKEEIAQEQAGFRP